MTKGAGGAVSPPRESRVLGGDSSPAGAAPDLGRERGEGVAELCHGGCGADTVARDIADGEYHAAVSGGGRVKPVAADPAGPLGGQIPDSYSQPGKVDRFGRDRQDDVLKLGGEAVFGCQGAPVLA